MAMDLNAKAAYIRGMMKGMEFDPTTQEGKIIVAMMDLLEEMADVVSEHDDALDQAFDELDAIDESDRDTGLRPLLSADRPPLSRSVGHFCWAFQRLRFPARWQLRCP